MHCCPDEARVAEDLALPKNVVRPFIDPASVPEFPKPLNTEQIENHQNFGLINIDCGIKTYPPRIPMDGSAILNGAIARAGEFPWM